MSRCRNIQNSLLTDHLDGRLNAGSRKSIDDHLASCADCRAVHSSARQADDCLHQAPPLLPPDHCWTAIRARIDAAAAEKFSWNTLGENLFGARRQLAWASLATVIILAGVTLPILSGPRPSPLSPYAGSALMALMDDRDSTADDAGLDTNAEYLLTYKESI